MGPRTAYWARRALGFRSRFEIMRRRSCWAVAAGARPGAPRRPSGGNNGASTPPRQWHAPESEVGGGGGAPGPAAPPADDRDGGGVVDRAERCVDHGDSAQGHFGRAPAGAEEPEGQLEGVAPAGLEELVEVEPDRHGEIGRA